MKKHIVLSFMLSLLLAGGLYGQATLSMQGAIRNSTGSAVPDGTYSLTFKLYTVESGGTAVWTETQDDIRVVGGVYSALLGATTPLNAAFNVPYYVGVAVDGGAELIPRFRLTSAPYALSLIGQSNTFPSAGNVGVGTVAPEAKLHVNNADGHIRQIISTSNDYGASLLLKAGNHTGFLDVNQYAYTMQSDNKSINIVPTSSEGRVHLYGNGSLKAYTDEHGFNVRGRQDISEGDGNNDPYLTIRSGNHISSFQQLSDGTGQIYISGTGNIIAGGRLHLHGEGAVKLYTDGQGVVTNGRLHVNGQGFSYGWFSHSDIRTKKDMRLSPGSTDLKTLMGLKVTDFRYLDPKVRGGELVKGFVAQEVEQSYPEAVSKAVGFLPSILSKAVSVSGQGDTVTIAIDKAHGLAVGDRVRIVGGNGTFKDVQVTGVPDNRSFTAGGLGNELQKGEVMVYGKEVSDFRSVDYNSIFTLNVSATQELARRVAQLEAENAALRQKSGEAEGLRSELNDLKARFTKLESLISTNANR